MAQRLNRVTLPPTAFSMASRSPPAMAVAIAAAPGPSTTQEDELVMPGKIKSLTSLQPALRT